MTTQIIDYPQAGTAEERLTTRRRPGQHQDAGGNKFNFFQSVAATPFWGEQYTECNPHRITLVAVGNSGNTLEWFSQGARPAVHRVGDRIKIDENLMMLGMAYEVQTPQGPMQFIKGSDGKVRMYELYDVTEEQIAG